MIIIIFYAQSNCPRLQHGAQCVQDRHTIVAGALNLTPQEATGGIRAINPPVLGPWLAKKCSSGRRAKAVFGTAKGTKYGTRTMDSK